MTKFNYNDVVRVTHDSHGRTGVIVVLPTPPCDTYTVEFDDGSDATLLETQLVLSGEPSNNSER